MSTDSNAVDSGKTEWLNLLDLLPDGLSNHPNFCDSVYYHDWEVDVAEPELRRLGYTIKRWRTLERDSFGPLSRGVTLVKDGVSRDYFYG